LQIKRTSRRIQARNHSVECIDWTAEFAAEAACKAAKIAHRASDARGRPPAKRSVAAKLKVEGNPAV
jgi:hypothetical protein